MKKFLTVLLLGTTFAANAGEIKVDSKVLGRLIFAYCNLDTSRADGEMEATPGVITVDEAKHRECLAVVGNAVIDNDANNTYIMRNVRLR